MNAKQRKTLTAIFAMPSRSDVAWSDVESLFRTLGGEVSEGAGSRVRVALNGVRAVFHRPHPERATDKGTLKSVRRFLLAAGIGLDEITIS
jgi:HicA toxin of bacterial toxin-antitoxin,